MSQSFARGAMLTRGSADVRAWVIGHPIGHSLSPVLHTAAYRALGLDHTFERANVEAEHLPHWVEQIDRDTMLGLAVTMPHKRAIMGFLDVIDPLAQATMAVNTVVPAGRVLAGFNTDVHGIVEAARETAGHRSLRRAVIIGSGATACSALAAVGTLHIREITIVARRFDGPYSIRRVETQLGITAEFIPWRLADLAARRMAEADLVISTVPAGVGDCWANRVHFQPDATVLDVVYSPWPTELAQQAQNDGARVAPGTLMLLHQAALQVSLMTGREAPVALMREALTAAIEGRET